MSFLLLSKAKLTMACVTGGTCAASIPFAIYSNQEKTVEQGNTLQQVSEEIKEVGTPKVTEQIANLNKNTNEEFESLWMQVEKEYKEQQSDAQRKNQGLNWKDEFKGILEKEAEIEGQWRITKQEWKDCRSVGGQDSYCGYIELERESNKYRLRIDRYSLTNKQWEITIVKADGNKVKWWDSKDKSWKSANYEIQKFGGEQQERQGNWWVKLETKSIWKS